MHRTTFLIDVDGVLANFVRGYLDIANSVGLTPPTKENAIDLWDVGDALGLTAPEKERVHEYLFAPGFALYLKPYSDTVTGLCRWMDFRGGHEIAFVTSPLRESPTWDYDRRLWVKKHLGKEAEKNTIFTWTKQRVHGDVLIDDKIENVEAWAETHPDGDAVVWAQPWNSNFHLHPASALPNVTRERNLDHIFERHLIDGR